MKINKSFKWFAVVISTLLLLPLLFMLNPLVLFPHNRIVISLPFSPEVDIRTGLIPMGEKIEHNEKNGNPNGHEGIDFGWDEKTAVIASHDGVITGIQNTSEGINITINTLFYKTVYKELSNLPKGIKLFHSIKQGDLLGYPIMSEFNENGVNHQHGQVHWEFSSSSLIIDRLCPVNYFDVESKKRIEVIWKNVPEDSRFKKEYPEICNGAFVGKEY